MTDQIINLVETKYLRKDIPDFRVGQTVSVHVKISEGGKERIQQFIGVVIAFKGSGVGETFTVRRIVANQGVERTFMLHSPRIHKIEITRSGKVRQAKLYYLRDRIGKARRLREKRMKRTLDESADATATPEADSPADEQELATVES